MPWFRRRRRDECRPERPKRPSLIERLTNWALGKLGAWAWGKVKSMWPWAVAILIALGVIYWRAEINHLVSPQAVRWEKCDCHKWGEGRPCCDRCTCCEHE